MQLAWACEEQLFRQELENADDIRLSVRLYTRCIREKRKFCADVEPGGCQQRPRWCIGPQGVNSFACQRPRSKGGIVRHVWLQGKAECRIQLL